MNGDWCCYSAYNTCLDADIYLELYNYFYKIFEEEGANKYLIYIFNPNGRSFPDFTYNHESLYRPDKDKYDIVGLTLYNTGTYYPDENWETFDELYKDLYDYVDKNYDRPMMITEFSSSITGGDKMAWTEDMFKSIANYPKIKLAIWFSGTDYDAFGNPARIYNIDEPKELLDVFKKYLGKSLDKEESI